MKNILIKFGKISGVLRRDGFWAGMKTIFSRYLFLYLKTIFSPVTGDVLIITGGVGDSAHYRAFNQAEELNLHGIKTSVMMAGNPFLSRYANKCKVFIFQRTLVTPIVAKLIENIKAQNKEIIFETDDLVFDAKFIRATDLYRNKMNAAEKLQYQKGVGAELMQDPYVKVCTTTTTYLAKILGSYGKKVFIVTNKFSNHDLEVTQNILDNSPKAKDAAVRLGYFSGTASHNQDFASIADALMQVMEKYVNVKLFLAGPLDTENKLNRFKERIVVLPFVPRDKYYENIWQVDVALAPLITGDQFCESKSAIKFTEAGLLKIPTVAVKNQTFSEAIADGVDGFLAGDMAEWAEKIGRLIEDADLRRAMGEKAREKVLYDYTNKNSHTEDYYSYLRHIITD